MSQSKEAPQPDFTMDELVALLRGEAGREAEGLTAAEIVLAIGRSRTWVDKRLNDLNRRGRLRIGHKRSRDRTGRLAWLPTYSLVAEEDTGSG